MNREVRDIATKWYKIATEIKDKNDRNEDIFFHFIALWISFNAIYDYEYYDFDKEVDRVVEFFKNDKVSDKHKELFNTNSSYKEAFDYIKSKGVFDVRDRRKRYIADNNQELGLALCIYQVRCNLFHGGKTPDNLRDKNLVKSSYILLTEILRPYFID